MAGDRLVTPLPKGPALPARQYVWDDAAGEWRAMRGGSDGTVMLGGHTYVRSFNLSATGTNTVTAVSTGIKCFKAYLSVEEDITGHVSMELGAAEVARVRNPIKGGPLCIYNPSPNYDEITATGAVKVVLPTATAMTAVTLTLHYEL